MRGVDCSFTTANYKPQNTNFVISPLFKLPQIAWGRVVYRNNGHEECDKGKKLQEMKTVGASLRMIVCSVLEFGSFSTF